MLPITLLRISLPFCGTTTLWRHLQLLLRASGHKRCILWPPMCVGKDAWALGWMSAAWEISELLLQGMLSAAVSDNKQSMLRWLVQCKRTGTWPSYMLFPPTCFDQLGLKTKNGVRLFNGRKPTKKKKNQSKKLVSVSSLTAYTKLVIRRAFLAGVSSLFFFFFLFLLLLWSCLY